MMRDCVTIETCTASFEYVDSMLCLGTRSDNLVSQRVYPLLMLRLIYIVFLILMTRKAYHVDEAKAELEVDF